MITGDKHELERVSRVTGNVGKGLSRLEYYTNLKFVYDIYNINVVCKVDTGSPYTVIGVKNKAWEFMASISGKIMSKLYRELPDSGKNLVSATGREFMAKFLTVRDLTISDINLSIPLNILISEDMGDRAVIGMDILTLFQFSYKFDNGSTNGSIWLLDSKTTRSRICYEYKNRGVDSISPYTIMSIDDANETLANTVDFGEDLTLDI